MNTIDSTKTTRTFFGKSASYIINNSEIKTSKAGVPEIFYGSFFTVHCNYCNELVLKNAIGTNGTVAVLGGLSKLALKRIKEMIKKTNQMFPNCIS